MSARDLIDTDLYPIDEPESHERKQLVERCRAELDEHALCCLPDFVRPEGLRAIIKEMRALEDEAHYNDYLRTAYGWMDNSGFPRGHPRSALFARRFGYLLTHQVPDVALIRALFFWDPLTDFVRDALGFTALFRSACPTLSIQLNYMREGDVLPWHFDSNDGVVSLLLDSADEGGQFQVAPYVREEHDEHYDLVQRAFDEDPGIVREPRMPPGTFILFKGRRSVHRVSPVEKSAKPRMIVLYSYDEKPEMEFPEATQNRMRYPDTAPYLGAGTPLNADGFSVWKPDRSRHR